MRNTEAGASIRNFSIGMVLNMRSHWPAKATPRLSEPITTEKFAVGQSVRRIEDPRLIQGLGREGFALKVPIVQGEFEHAHLCRLVGSLEIQGARLAAALPAGSEIELALELDRGGQLRASARVISTNQVFDEVALLVTQKMSFAELEQAMSRLEARANEQSRNAFLSNSASNVARLSSARTQLEQFIAEGD